MCGHGEVGEQRMCADRRIEIRAIVEQDGRGLRRTPDHQEHDRWEESLHLTSFQFLEFSRSDTVARLSDSALITDARYKPRVVVCLTRDAVRDLAADTTEPATQRIRR